MKAVNFEGVNVQEFGKPKNWDDEKDGICHAIPAAVHEDEHNRGKVYVVTAWLPSEKDKEEMAKGKPVYLQCWGGMPPVMLYTIDDEGQPNFED